MRLGSASMIAFALSSVACRFVPGGASVDGAADDADSDGEIPDAGPCQSLGASCAGDSIRRCTSVGVPPEEEICAWGCLDAQAGARCGVLVPSGGGVLPSDLDVEATLVDAVWSDVTTIDGDTGLISGGFTRAAGTGINNGVGWVVRGDVAVFTFSSLVSSGTVTFTGTNSKAVAFAARGTIQLAGQIDVRGGCGTSNTPGPGGFAGGTGKAAGLGPGGGDAVTTNKHGGGGGGHGAAGGPGATDVVGNAGPSGGVAYGTDAIAQLRGGSGGGGGTGGGNAVGGGGGGALQLVSNTAIQISGGLNAGGCGGESKGGGNDGGGGGGAGGTLLLEAPMIEIDGVLAVNGGGAGAGDADTPAFGQPGGLSRVPAAGAPGGASGGGDGGNGAAGATLVGDAGAAVATKAGGGGGGAIGRIRFHTRGGVNLVLGSTVLSPALDDDPTTCTHGSAVVQ